MQERTLEAAPRLFAAADLDRDQRLSADEVVRMLKEVCASHSLVLSLASSLAPVASRGSDRGDRQSILNKPCS